MIARFLPQMGQAPLLLLLRHAFLATIVHNPTGIWILFKNKIKNLQKYSFQLAEHDGIKIDGSKKSLLKSLSAKLKDTKIECFEQNIDFYSQCALPLATMTQFPSKEGYGRQQP